MTSTRTVAAWTCVLACAATSPLIAPDTAHAIVVGSQTSTAGASVRLAGQVFGRGRGRRPDGGEQDWEFELSRARLKVSFRYGRWLRADIEPDFGGPNADLADVFLQIRPHRTLDLRIGQMKTPYGLLEIESRWRLPSLTRGVTRDVVTRRLGFGARRFGARARWRAKDLPLRPAVEFGVFGDQTNLFGDDIAGRISVRAMKGLRVHLAGYIKDKVTSSAGRGFATAASALYDRKGLYLAGEVQLGRARLTSRSGIVTGVDATFVAGRAVAGYRIDLPPDFQLEPFLAGEVLDPNSETRDDLTVAYRLGASLYWLDRFRLAAEFDRQTGQLGSIVTSRSTVTILAGVTLR